MAKSLHRANFEGLDASLLAESGLLELGALEAVTEEPDDEEIAKAHAEAAPVTPPLAPSAKEITLHDPAVEDGLPTFEASVGIYETLMPLEGDSIRGEAKVKTSASHASGGQHRARQESPSPSGSSAVAEVDGKPLMARSVAQLVGWRALPKQRERYQE